MLLDEKAEVVYILLLFFSSMSCSRGKMAGEIVWVLGSGKRRGEIPEVGGYLGS